MGIAALQAPPYTEGVPSEKTMTFLPKLLSRGPLARTSRLFSKYLLSYLAIVCISLLMGVVTYFISIRVIDAEIAKAHYGSLKQVQKLNDAILNDLKAVYIQIGFDQRIQFLMSLEGEMTPEQLIESARTVGVLNRCRMGSPIVKEIYLYMDRSRLVLTDTGKYTMDTFYESIFPYGGDLFRRWITQSPPGFTIFPREGQSHAAVYVEPLPIGSAVGYLGRLVVVLDEDLLLRTMEDLRWMPESRMLITDAEGRTLARGADADLPRADLVVSRVPSEASGWQYVSMIPAAVFHGKARQVRNAIILCLAVCLLSGIWISWIFAKRSYGPVDKLVRFIQDNLKRAKAEGDDEYRFIQGILEAAMLERTESQEDRSRETNRLKDEFLANLSQGRLDDTAVGEMKGLYGLDLDPLSTFAVLFVSVEDSGPMGRPEEGGDGMEEGPLAAGRILIRTMGEWIRPKYGILPYLGKNRLVCLVDAGRDDPERVQESIRQAVGKAIDMMRSRLRMSYSVSVSGCHAGYSGIRTAYREAEEAMEYLSLLGRERLVFFREWKRENGRTAGISFQKDLELFSQSVASKDTENAERILSRIFKDWIEGCSHSAGLIRHRMNQVTGSFIAAAEDLDLACGGGFPDIMPMIDVLLQCRSQAELQERIRELLAGLSRFIREREERTPDLQQQVVRYINENYGNSSVNVSAIADAFSLGIPNLSRLFKKSMGIGPLEYLQLLRIGKAKRLLEDGDENLKEIIGKVGFDNDVSFIRVFKKYEGITPGQYRKRVR